MNAASKLVGKGHLAGISSVVATAAAVSIAAKWSNRDEVTVTDHESSADNNNNTTKTQNTKKVPTSCRTTPQKFNNKTAAIPTPVSLIQSLVEQQQNNTHCQCEPSAKDHDSSNDDAFHRRLLLQRRRTHRILSSKANKHRSLSSLYAVDWSRPPLGTGAFGDVFFAVHKPTGERVALKRIPKKVAASEDFQREMEALLRIQKWGGHPHICALREHFDEGGYYYLILDLIEGGEMFDHLVNHGAYSEADAARLVREVASALDFLHGIGVVHNDIKPENLMLSTSDRRDGVVQLVDFGCAEVEGEDDDDDDHDIDDLTTKNGKGAKKKVGMGGFTPAYCPPEAFTDRSAPPLPPADMWALGVIVYIMLTGVHPFDIKGRATDEEIERDITNSQLALPLGPRHPYTRHLSPSARDLIRRLMNRDPKERLTAFDMLHHPWVTGETASKEKIAGSHEKLNKFRKFKTKVQQQFFSDAVMWSDEAILDETRRKTSLIERSFKAFDGTDRTIKKLLNDNSSSVNSNELNSITMSDYHDMLAENMKQKYFPKGHVVYREGEEGNHMYFINSGTVEVITKDGIVKDRHQGDFFGEGALLHPRKIRSATIRCKTPVNAIEINREYFEKYMASSTGLLLTLKEKDKIRKRNRAKAILMLQNGMKSISLKNGEQLYQEGEMGDSLYIVEKGRVEVTTAGHQVLVATAGNFCGEHSLLTGRVRNTTAKCISKDGCVATRMTGHHFRKLMDVSPHMKESLIDMQNRRDFKKAVVKRLGHEFPYHNPREAFDSVDVGKKGYLGREDVAQLMREMDKDYTDDEVEAMMQTLDLSVNGRCTFDEFKKVFIGDIRTTQSM